MGESLASILTFQVYQKVDRLWKKLMRTDAETDCIPLNEALVTGAIIENWCRVNEGQPVIGTTPTAIKPAKKKAKRQKAA